jgi:hypothetical protein
LSLTLPKDDSQTPNPSAAIDSALSLESIDIDDDETDAVSAVADRHNGLSGEISEKLEHLRELANVRRRGERP